MTYAEVVREVELPIDDPASEESAHLSNSELTNAVDAWIPVRGVSLRTVRETTQRRVKVPKCGLSATEGGPEPQTAGR